jgi:hypothetical protein
MARAVLPGLVDKDPLDTATLPVVEDALRELNSQAEESMAHKGRVPRRVKRRLTRYAHRLLDITEVEPDLHEALSFNLIGHAADATGERELLAIALDQARRADIDTDTNANLRAIEAALELDKPFADVMRTLSNDLPPIVAERYEEKHVPLGPEYDFLFDRQAPGAVTRRKDSDEHYPMHKVD